MHDRSQRTTRDNNISLPVVAWLDEDLSGLAIYLSGVEGFQAAMRIKGGLGITLLQAVLTIVFSTIGVYSTPSLSQPAKSLGLF